MVTIAVRKCRKGQAESNESENLVFYKFDGFQVLDSY